MGCINHLFENSCVVCDLCCNDTSISVQLTKQTTVQATSVASNLVEIIQGSGFRLQALNLSFEDEEDTKN